MPTKQLPRTPARLLLFLTRSARHQQANRGVLVEFTGYRRDSDAVYLWRFRRTVRLGSPRHHPPAQAITHPQPARCLVQFASLIEQFAVRAPERRAACECDPTLAPISNASRNSRRAVGISSVYFAAIPARLCASTLAN